MAIEDAAALGIIFNKDHFNGDIDEALSVYQEIRLPRVTKVRLLLPRPPTTLTRELVSRFL